VLDDSAGGAAVTDVSARAAIAKFVGNWLERKIETPQFISEYWRLRNCLLDAQPEVFTGRFGVPTRCRSIGQAGAPRASG
jgi:hypothetical protein